MDSTTSKAKMVRRDGIRFIYVILLFNVFPNGNDNHFQLNCQLIVESFDQISLQYITFTIILLIDYDYQSN
ncbi:hypothetical protein GCM10011409_16480 [Lentibacillus populi]|uniref:Uncharacterized protein n=1 Tax=Lentibacillus populi TaxID=1827502 RepID=A0A9W5X509_9BACI|nr:hypothetical protein GCM10011409_16480 [Lentibacillus populi]